MAFGGIFFTNKGRALQAKAQIGIQLNFTRLAVGDGSLTGQAIADMTAFVHQIMSIPITKAKTLPGGIAYVGGILSNQGLATGFYWREFGLFAQDPDVGEILYCYGNAAALAEYIAAGGGADIIEKQVAIEPIIGSATNVTATINQSLVYATPQDVTDGIAQAKAYTDTKVAAIVVPVTSVNTKTGTVVLVASDIKAADGSTLEAFKTTTNASLADMTNKQIMLKRKMRMGVRV